MQATKAPLTAPSFPKPTRTRWCRSSRRSDLPQETVMATPSPAAKKSFQWKPRWLWWTLLVLLLLGAIVGFTAWYKIFREEPQPDWVTATPEMRFKYGSIGAENEAGQIRRPSGREQVCQYESTSGVAV